MTMPHLENCQHSDDGWCLACVEKQWHELNAWQQRVDEWGKSFKVANEGRIEAVVRAEKAERELERLGAKIEGRRIVWPCDPVTGIAGPKMQTAIELALRAENERLRGMATKLAYQAWLQRLRNGNANMSPFAAKMCAEEVDKLIAAIGGPAPPTKE